LHSKTIGVTRLTFQGHPCLCWWSTVKWLFDTR